LNWSRTKVISNKHQIEVGNIVVDVVRKNIKNLHLRVYQPSGRVRIAAPLRIDDETVRLFVISKIPWIKKQQSRFEGQEPQPKHEFVAGESHYYCGKPYLLNVVYQDAPPRVELSNKDHMDLYVRPDSDKAKREKIMTEWYRSKLKEQIPDLIEKWQRVISVEVDDWGVKKMKTRWGTCNRKTKRIWLNLELSKKPVQCLEFIIVHELTHLIERRHNRSFKTYMDEFMPQWRVYEDELKSTVLDYC